MGRHRGMSGTCWTTLSDTCMLQQQTTQCLARSSVRTGLIYRPIAAQHCFTDIFSVLNPNLRDTPTEIWETGVDVVGVSHRSNIYQQYFILGDPPRFLFFGGKGRGQNQNAPMDTTQDKKNH